MLSKICVAALISVLGMLNKLGKEKTLQILSASKRNPPFSKTDIDAATQIFDNIIK